MSKYRTITETVFDPVHKKYQDVMEYFNSAVKEQSDKAEMQKKATGPTGRDCGFNRSKRSF